jgi:carbamoyltransferase
MKSLFTQMDFLQKNYMNLIDSNYKILGIIGGLHSCGVAYIENGNIKYCFEEERFSRVKSWRDFEEDFFRYPLQSLNRLIYTHEIDLNQVDYFTSFLDYNFTKNMLKDTLGFDLPLEKYIRIEHHDAHCTLAYYLSGFKNDTLIVSLDAGGDNHVAKYYFGNYGDMFYIDGVDIYRKSLGHFYAALTELLGFKRLKDEGKVVGMAGHGNLWIELYNAWKDIIKIEDLRTQVDPKPGISNGLYKEIYEAFFDIVGSSYWKRPQILKDIACTGQFILEEKVLELLEQLHAKYPNAKNIALAGGVFANVKLNKKINDLEWVDEVFVAPPMGDEGLALGCAIGTLKKLHINLKPTPASTMYFGAEYSESEILDAAKSELKNYNIQPFSCTEVADLLLNKKIIGLYQGKSEHGPRALGNRSIICDATDPETYDILNSKLQRNDFMPFAPAVLEEDADILFKVDKSKHAAEFMTMLYDTQDEWKDKLPTVVHPVDKTARIQIVKQQTEGWFWSILKEYKNKTGFGCLVNTSFNVHNEPIVNHPGEAFRHLRNGIVDYLVTPYGIFSLVD